MKQTELTITDYNLKDTVEHGSEEFPIQYYVDELYCYSKQMLSLIHISLYRDYSSRVQENKLYIGFFLLFLKHPKRS